MTTKTTPTRKVRSYEFVPVLFDQVSPGRLAPAAGTLVVKTQPAGCPRNGTMGHTFIADAHTGEFYGLVCTNSLQPRATVADPTQRRR